MTILLQPHTYAGKITLSAVSIGALAVVVGLFAFFEAGVQEVRADDVTTSVTVLNTPPVWTVDAQENPESSASNPTNTGTSVTWTATGTDNNSDDYFLIICKTGDGPLARADAPPVCTSDGSTPDSSLQWAVSATTTSAQEATAATTTTEAFPESNDWYAWICDAHSDLPRCNSDEKQGSGSTASPFVVNYPPLFTAIANDAPKNPGQIVQWSATASSSMTVAANPVRLFVCGTANFTPGTGCDDSTLGVTSPAANFDPTATTSISIPTYADTYDAYVFVVDSFDHMATSSTNGSNSTYEINNVAPVVDASTIDLLNWDTGSEDWVAEDLELFEPFATSGPYKVTFTADDDNGCEIPAGSGGGYEMSAAKANIYRSGVGQASCNASGHYNANSCYAYDSPMSDIQCTAQTDTCVSGQTEMEWECTFSLWFVADPTDGADLSQSTWFDEEWLASTEVSDVQFATSTLTETTAGLPGVELNRFLAFDVTQSAVAYDSLEPGQESALNKSTDLQAGGNTGLDEDLYGDTMCTTWTAPDSCDPVDPETDIAVNNQQFATSSVAYGAAGSNALTSSSSPSTLLINVQKTTATSTPSSKDTFWGIRVPGTITLAGDYAGQNTITAITSDATAW